MTTVMRITYATIDFILVNIAASSIHPSPDLITWTWYCLSVILAFSLRLGIEYDNNKLTKRNLLKQTIFTVSWVFLSVLVYKEMHWGGWFEVYLFLNSLFGVFFVSQLEESLKIGVKGWLRLKLSKFIAEEKGDVNP